MHPYRRSRGPTWRIAGLWMVVLALGLAVIGIFLAIQQARSFTHRLMAQAEAEASRIAEAAGDQFEQQLAGALRTVADHMGTTTDAPWQPQRGFPSWLDGLFAWTGREVVVVAPVSAGGEKLTEIVKVQLAALGPPNRIDQQPAFLYHNDTNGHTPVVLAYLSTKSTNGQSRRAGIVAGHLDLNRLKSDFLKPLLSPYDGLELVPAGTSDKPWSQPLHGAMRFWSIQPTEAFILKQRNLGVGQTLVYLALTILALTTLLVAMWVLVRVVRRDMALAKLKADFVADVSHELKTPLALIRLFGETLQSGRVASEAKRQEYYDIITRESARLTHLINNILDFARIEAGRKDYRLEPTDIGHVVRDTCEAYRAQLEHNRFEHHLTVEPSLPLVNADREAIARVLINLINNAIKYSGEERYFAIDVTKDTRRGRFGVLISVHDRGIGIRPEDRARLFEGFFRSSDGRVREQSGAGLGLGLVKHIVDGHHGSLDVESRLVKGSTFRIFLPAANASEP